jgi:hypothetical protein
MRKFETGATRDADDCKLDYDGFLSPLALERFAQYMDKHRQTPAGRRDSDNWQKGIPLESYRKSFLRHAFDAWKLGRSGAMVGDAIEELLCAVLFNVQGWLHEAINARLSSPRRR